MTEEYVERTFRPLWEARQEAQKPVCEGDNRGKRYLERLEGLYGPCTGEIIESDVF